MHNKLLVMDNAVGIVGGRNIADVYFGVSEDHNYRDLDVLTTGPIVREISASFDLFWNSDWAIPVGAMMKEPLAEKDWKVRQEQFEESVNAAGYPYPIYQNVDELRARLVQIRDNFIWAPGHVLVELPDRVETDAEIGVIHQALSKRLSEVEREVLVESPYFVLPEANIEGVRKLTARGVKVRVLTNSAASNDVIAAHAGYENTARSCSKLVPSFTSFVRIPTWKGVGRFWRVNRERPCTPSLSCSTASRFSLAVSTSTQDRRPSTLRSV